MTNGVIGGAMALKLVNQTPADLVLAVMSHTLPANLQIIKQATLTRGAWRVIFRIIGESHAISVCYDDVPVLHEILACVDIEQNACAHLHPFTALQAHHYSAPDGYQVGVNFDETPSWEQATADYPVISVGFPQVYGISPLTRIQWQATASGVRWWTLHTYPTITRTDDKMRVVHVHSHSVFNFDRRMNCAEHKIAYNQT